MHGISGAPTGDFAFTVADNKLVQKEVRIGDRTGSQVEILSGVSHGQSVALPAKEGALLREGAEVKIVGAGAGGGPDASDGSSEPAPKKGRGTGRAKSGG
jgi:hypothetical protein